MIRALIEKIYCFINNHRLTNEKIKTILDRKLRELLDENKADIYAVYWDEFDEETISAVEESEPGATKDGHEVIAFTCMNDDGNFDMVFALEAVKRFVAKENPLRLKSEIRGIARHEAFHVRQYRYVFEKGGLEALDRLFADVQKIEYEENVLEVGAYLFQYFGIEQDFPEDFALYVCKACA